MEGTKSLPSRYQIDDNVTLSFDGIHKMPGTVKCVRFDEDGTVMYDVLLFHPGTILPAIDAAFVSDYEDPKRADTYYTAEQLVGFANYIIIAHEGKGEVTHADLTAAVDDGILNAYNGYAVATA